MNIKELREALKPYPDDMEVIFEANLSLNTTDVERCTVTRVCESWDQPEHRSTTILLGKLRRCWDIECVAARDTFRIA